jgi:CRISPR-associated protein Csd1
VIIKALCDYYDILAEDGGSKISPYGCEMTVFSYEVVLTEDGELNDIIPLVTQKGDSPKSDIMPKSMKKPGIAASPVCDNMTYIAGVDGKKSEKKIDRRKFDAAKDLHLKLLKNATSKEAVAVRRFFEKWNADTAWENECIINAANDKGNAFSGNAAFRLKGECGYFHNCDEIKRIWREENERKAAEDGEYTAQCAITGENAAIAKLHDNLRGIKDAQPSGASLICFNKAADASYNLEQSYNSRVSETAMFKYTTVLQHLLNSKKNRLYIGGDTAVFWAYSPNSDYKDYEDIGLGLIQFSGNSDEGGGKEGFETDERTEKMILSILKNGVQGIRSNWDAFDPNVRFYILGLAPNAGRVSVRYFYQNSFADFCEKIKRYYDDTKICGKYDAIKVKSLIDSTVSTKSSDKKVNPLLGGAMMRALLSGGNYPQLLYNQVILRVKAEASTPVFAAIEQARAAAIKAYLTRNKKEEWLSMALNEKSGSMAYVLGMVFAILEKIQRDTAKDRLETTIKDRYFSTACSNPALVFPTLLKLTQHHLKTVERDVGTGLRITREKQLGDCLSLIEGGCFPKAQNLENQGKFILGYYQQTQNFYKSKEES